MVVMALLEAFKFDVFISYSHTDNQPKESGWVTRLKTELDRITPARLIRGDFKICFDLKDIDGAGALDARIRTNVEGSALLLIVLSRSYLQSPWCLEELSAFLGHNDTAVQRIIVVDKDNVLKDHEFLELLKINSPPENLETTITFLNKLYRYEFWERDNVGRAYTLADRTSHDANASSYLKRIRDLCEGVANEILNLLKKSAPAAETALKRDDQTSVNVTPIFIALTPDSLKSRRRDLQRSLEQTRLVSVRPLESPPEDVQKFEKFVRSELRDAKLFVQLIGSTGPVGPDDLPDEFVRAQLRIADEMKKPKLHWRSLDLDPSDFIGADCDINKTEMVRAETINAFRNAVLEQLRQLASNPPPPPRGPQDRPIVFIDATEKDMIAAKTISDQVFHDCVCFFPPGSDNGIAQRSKVEYNFAYCDGALIVHHAEPDDDWAQVQLLRYVRARRQRDEEVKFLVLFNRKGRPAPQVDRLDELEIISSQRADDIGTLARLATLLSR
jgi:hypothetical protein